jgi:hypothetical protein
VNGRENPTASDLHSSDQEDIIMFRQITTALGIVFLASSFAVAGQNTASTSNAPKPQQPVTTPKAESTVQRNSTQATLQRKTKKHRKHHKVSSNQTQKAPSSPTTTKTTKQ